MANFCVLLVVVLVAGVSSQPYPRFEFRSNVLKNNSFVIHGLTGEGKDDSLQTTLSVVLMGKVTGMMREEMKSIRDQMGTVTCMSLEGREWSISIVEQEEV